MKYYLFHGTDMVVGAESLKNIVSYIDTNFIRRANPFNHLISDKDQQRVFLYRNKLMNTLLDPSKTTEDLIKAEEDLVTVREEALDRVASSLLLEVLDHAGAEKHEVSLPTASGVDLWFTIVKVNDDEGMAHESMLLKANRRPQTE